MEMYYGVGHEDVKHTIWDKIVYMLMNGYKNKNHNVKHDNHLSNPLYWDLLKVGIHVIGTQRTNCKKWLNVLIVDPKKRLKGIAYIFQVS